VPPGSDSGLPPQGRTPGHRANRGGWTGRLVAVASVRVTCSEARKRLSDSLLRLEGTRTPAWTTAPGRAALPKRELEIARLAATGLVNRGIAARRYLSHRTVENKLYAVGETLGVTGRAELAQALEGWSLDDLAGNRRVRLRGHEGLLTPVDRPGTNRYVAAGRFRGSSLLRRPGRTGSGLARRGSGGPSRRPAGAANGGRPGSAVGRPQRRVRLPARRARPRRRARRAALPTHRARGPRPWRGVPHAR
jgi:DNA-binding CsgD family transcriptional regulator